MTCILTFQKKSTKPLTESEQIHDEIERLVSECECPHKFEVFKVAEGKYRVSRVLRVIIGDDGVIETRHIGERKR